MFRALLATALLLAAACGKPQIALPPQLEVLSFSPENGSVSVDTELSVTVEFDAKLDQATVTADSLFLLDGTQKVPVRRAFPEGGDVVVLIPTAPLDGATVYQTVVTTDVASVQGATLSGELRSRFTTED